MRAQMASWRQPSNQIEASSPLSLCPPPAAPCAAPSCRLPCSSSARPSLRPSIRWATCCPCAGGRRQVALGLQLGSATTAGGRGLRTALALIHFNRVWPLDPYLPCSTMFLMVSEQGGWVAWTGCMAAMAADDCSTWPSTVRQHELADTCWTGCLIAGPGAPDQADVRWKTLVRKSCSVVASAAVLTWLAGGPLDARPSPCMRTVPSRYRWSACMSPAWIQPSKGTHP